MTQQVPDIGLGRSRATGDIFAGTPTGASPAFVARPPAPQMPIGGRASRKAVGLLPAVPGAFFPLIQREAPKTRTSPADASRARAAVRAADAQQKAAETAWAATATHDGNGDTALLTAAQSAVDRAAMLRRQLAEMDAASRTRPLMVINAIVREPSACADALSDESRPPVYVCLHDGCTRNEWASEDEMRRDHPTHSEMSAKQQAHVFALRSSAPLDPLDPDGPTIGLIAPIGSDGTTVARALESATDERAASDDVADLKALVVALTQQVADLAGKAAKK